MNNSNKTVKLTFDVGAKLDTLRGQVGDIKNLLGGLKMPDSLAKNANKEVDDLLERIKKIKDYTEGNNLKLVDENKVRSEFDGIQKDFRHLVEKLNENGSKIKLGDSKSADALRKGIEKYRKGIESATTAIEKQRDKVRSLQNDLNKKQAKVDMVEYYKKDAQDRVNAELEALEKIQKAEEAYLEKNKEKSWTDPQRKANLKRHLVANGYDLSLSKTFNPDAENRLAAARANLAKKTSALERAQEQMRVEGNKLQQQISDETATLKTYEDSLKQLSEQELKKVKEELTKLQEGGGVSFKFNPEDINSIEDLEEKLKEIDDQDMSAITQVLEKIGVACKSGAEGAEELDKGIDKDVDSFKELNSTLDEFKTKANYFFGMTNAINLLRRAVNAAFNTVKDLDEVMTQTAVVTDFSVGDMWSQLPEYTRRANELGVSIHDAYEAATLYYQQGLKTDQVMAVSNETLKMARIANLDAAEATSRMTNALRGFNMEINESNAQRVNDVYSELAAITAADTDEISRAMTKVASLAHNANMEFETTSAFLAQVIETTRESAETAGTALKTVIARFSEVKDLYNQGELMGSDEEGEEIDVNKVSVALRSAGINLNEYLTGAKGLDDIFIELASKWDKLDMVQQRYIATMAAGSRQQSRFIAMMSDYKRTTELVTAANTSAGASQKQFEKTLDSLKSKLAQLKNSWDTFLMGIADDTIIKVAIDLLKTLLDIVNKIFEGVDKLTEAYTGGAGGAVIRISALFLAFKLGNVIVTQAIALFKDLAVSKAEDAAATANLAKEEAKEAGVKQFGLVVGKRSLLYTKQDVGAKGAQTVATKGLTAATLRLVYTTLAYTAAIVGLIAFFAGLVKLIDALSERSPSEIFKDAQKSTEAATSAANSLTMEYNNLKSSLDGLDEKYESIEKLTRGSQEWKDAVKEVNEEVLNLMSNYDGLEIKNENGLLKVANQEKVVEDYAKRYTDAQAARVGAQLHQTEAEKNVNYTDLEKKLYSEDYNFLEGYEPTKELIDKVAKNLVDSDLYGKTMDEIKVGVSSALHFSREVTDEDIKNLREYGKSLNELNQKTLAYADTLAASAVANAKLVENTEEAAGSFMNANRLESLYIEEFNKLEGERFTDIQEQLAQALGFNNYGEYKQEHGEISGESARVQLAQIRAQEKATENVQVFSKKLSGLNNEVQKVYSRGDKLGLTQKDVNESLEAIGYNFNGNELQEAQKVTDYVRDLWNNLKPEVQDAFGEFADFQKDYIEAIFGSYAALRDAEEEFKLFSGSIDGFKESLNAGSLKQLGLNLIDVFDASGSEAAKTIQDEISSIMNESLKDEQKAGFIDVLNSIDWSSVNSIETLDETLKGLGYDIPEKQLEKLVDDMINLGGATYKVNFEHVTDQLEKIGGLASRIKSGEQTSAGFSLEDMETAVGAGISKSDFYYNPDDNTFTYIGNRVDDIYNALLEQTDILIGQDALERQVENAKTFDAVYNTNFKSNVDTSDATALEAFLRVYLSKSGENSLISEEAINRRSGDVEGLKKLYDKLLENADNVKENTAALEAAKERADQTAAMMASIDENLAEGNLEAIQAKAKASGMDEDIYNALNANGIQSLGAATKEFMQAAKQGLDIDALNRYIKLLKKLNPELDTVLATQVAISNTKLNKGLQALIDSYDEWGTLIGEDGIALENLDSISSETWLNYKKNVNDLLGINEDLADSFYASADTTRLLTELIGGEETALYELRAAAAEQIWIDVRLNDGALEEDFERQKDIINDFIVNEAPTMEIGTVINTGPFADALNWILKNTSLTVDSINKIFGGIGGFELEPVYGPPPGMSGYEYAKSGKQIIIGYKMKSNNAKTTGAYVGGPSKMTNYKSDSGSGGSGGSEKTDTWENPYDELYNLTEKINEALRTREALERRYEKLVKKTSSTVSEVTKGYYDQIRHLRTEADLQKQMQEGRARQLDNVANEMYMDSEGNRSSFASLGVTKYASYNKETGVITIDWEGLEALEGNPSKVAEGEAAEAYISRLEELQGQYEEVRDKLWDIEDEIERLREEAIESYLSFEDRVMDDLVNHYQNQIDELSNLYDAIDQSTNEIIKGIQEEINYSRQIRDNTKKEEDIADKEARLAYLRRDTSGANAMEIKKLEEDIANSREQYSDTMVDQQIADMQNEAQLAAEQRQHQIEIMQNQLDVAQKNGELWGKVWELINTATAADGTFSQNSELVNLMKETEAYESLSVVGQQKWWENAAEAFLRAQSGLSEAEGKYGVDANGDGSVSSASSSANSSASSSSGSTSASGSNISTEGAGHFAKVGTYEHPMAQMPSNEVKELQQALNDAGFTDSEGNALKTDGIYGSRTRQAVWKLQEKLGNVKVDGYYGPETRSATLKSQFKAFATGGLADFTGPAWLDGTKSSPELVLNAKDTENFIALKNILANLLGGQGGDIIGNKGGDNYFDIHIDAEIGSDYDVDRLAERIEKKIYEKSSYRNVNAINYIR